MKDSTPYSWNCTVPVLLIAFNRPDTTQTVFNAIRQVAPRKLYFAVDGPREGRPDDEANRKEVINIVEQVDWPCEVQTLYHEVNRGCGKAPVEAINWAFEGENDLIILEDDCVPAQSFFGFCEMMLERYRNDNRVGIISGRSHQHGSKYFKKSDYIFSHYAHTCGWATWKNRWEGNDFTMCDYQLFIQMGGCKNVIPNPKQAIYINNCLQSVYDNIIAVSQHAWDYQWSYARLKNGWLDIVPCCNLIQNIGVGDNATHSKVATSSLTMPSEEMPSVIRHPRFVMVNYEYEELHFNNHIYHRFTLKKRFLGYLRLIIKPLKIFKIILKS